MWALRTPPITPHTLPRSLLPIPDPSYSSAFLSGWIQQHVPMPLLRIGQSGAPDGLVLGIVPGDIINQAPPALPTLFKHLILSV